MLVCVWLVFYVRYGEIQLTSKVSLSSNSCAVCTFVRAAQDDARWVFQAEALSEPYEFLRAVTYNNLACYYRRQGKLRTALKYLEKVELPVSNSSPSPAATLRSACASIRAHYILVMTSHCLKNRIQCLSLPCETTTKFDV